MDEKQENKEGEENNKSRPEDSGTGSEQKTTPLIDKTNEAAARMELATEKMNEAIALQDQLLVKQRLGGNAEAGGQAAEKKPESDEEFTQRFERGEVDLSQ